MTTTPSLSVLIPRTPFDLAIFHPYNTDTSALMDFLAYDWGPAGELMGLKNPSDVPLPEMLATKYGFYEGVLAVVLPPVPVTPQRALAIAIALGLVSREIGVQVERIARGDECEELSRWRDSFEPWNTERHRDSPAAWNVAISAWTLIFPLPAIPAGEEGKGKAVALHVCGYGWIGIADKVTPELLSALGRQFPLVVLAEPEGTISARISPELARGISEDFAECMRKGLAEHGFKGDDQLFTHPRIEQLGEVKTKLRQLEEMSHDHERYAPPKPKRGWLGRFGGGSSVN